jgi:hypothetical protein
MLMVLLLCVSGPPHQQQRHQQLLPSAREFPIAWFTGNIVCDNDANCDPEALRSFRSLPGPFNLAINYFHAISWRHTAPAPPALQNFSAANYRDYLDQCGAQNVSCMLGLPYKAVQRGAGAALAAQLATPVADHPALHGHFLYDEPWLEPGPPPTEPGTVSIQAIADVYRALKAADGAEREVVPCQAAHWINNDHGVGLGPPSPDFLKEESGAYKLASFADRVMFDYYLARINQTDRDHHVNAWWNVSARAGRFAREQHARHGLAEAGWWYVTDVVSRSIDLPLSMQSTDPSTLSAAYLLTVCTSRH